MTTPIESLRRAGTHHLAGMRRHDRWRIGLTAGLVLALVAILLGLVTSGEWAVALASLAGFAIAITAIAAVVISWEHLVVNARGAGLVEYEVESR